MKLSIAMIVKNEEKNLERTLIPLKKLQDYIDAEIIIVDTGSTDNSVDIAKKYTDKIYFHKWNSDFGSMRNLSIRYCTGDWILIVDADEELYDIEELANLINSKILKKYYSAFIKIVDFSQSIQNSVSSGAISPLLRLFKKNTVKYEGIIHEQPICSESTLDSQIRFIHYGYDNNNYELMEHKFQRNIKLLFKELDEKPNSIYVYFQIATSYLMHKDLQKALKYIEIAYKKASKKGLCNYIYVIDKYCLILYTLKSYDTLIYKAKEGIKYCDKFIDFYFYLGEAYNNLNQYDKAIQPYEMYLDLYKNRNKNDILAEFSISIFTIEYKNAVIYHLGLCYYQNKFYEKALSLILTIDDNNFMHDKITIICKIIEDGGLWNKFYILNNFIDIHNYDEILIFLHNNVFMENLIMINSQEIDGFLKEMLDIVIYFKNNGNINYKHLEKIKRIISRNKKLYSIYVYYVLKFDINEFDFFINYGKKELKNILSKLIFTYYDFGSYLENKLNNFKEYNTISVIKHNIIMEALLNSRKLQIDKRRILFLDFLADKFYSIVKLYKFEYICDNKWILPPKERFIIELKEAISYKYIDSIRYIKKIKDILNIDKSYVDYIKLLIEENEEFISNNKIKAFMPELVKNIEELINTKKYQEAYNTIEEALSLVKFDFDLMVLKYKLLVNFNYEKEAMQCLREIILYGDIERVTKLINNL